MRSLRVLLLVGAATAAQSALADDPPTLAAIRAACAQDAQKLCAGVQPGGGRIVACLKAHKDSLSDRCKEAGGLVANRSSSSAPGASIASPASETPASEAPASAASPSAPRPAASPYAKSSHSAGAAPEAAAATGTGSGSYLRMKQVQIIAPVVDPKLGNGKDPVNLPVLDLLIPSTWDFKSNVAFNTTSGCISDIFSLSWEAKGADGSIS